MSEIDSVVGLVHPVYRQGLVLQSTSACLSRSEAFVVADKITERSLGFVQAISNSVHVLPDLSLAKVDPGEFGRPEVPLNMRIWPVIVVDLPAICFRSPKYTIETRSCITVCVDERQSKCWTRVNLLSEWGDSVVDLFAEFEVLSENINRTVMTKYQEVLSECSGKPCDLGASFRIFIRSAVANDEEVDSYLSRPERLDSGKVRDVLDSYFDVLKGATIDTEAPVRSDVNVNSQFYGLMSVPRVSVGSASDSLWSDNEIASLAYRVEYGDDKAEIVAIGYDVAEDSSFPMRASSHIVSGKIASEYGELF